MNGWKVATLALVIGLGGVLFALAQSSETGVQDWWAANQGDPIRVSESEPDTGGPDDADGGSEQSDATDPREQAMENELASHFARVADVYEESSQYPPYSLPVSEETVDDYRYNTYTPVEVPISDDGEVRIQILLERLHFEIGEPIVGIVTLRGGAASDLALDRVRLKDQSRETLYSESLNTEGAGEYELVLSPGESQARDWPPELFVVVSGDYLGRNVEAVAPVRYEQRVGEIESVGSAFVEGAHLKIPVEADLEESGLFAISGNLYSESGRPLVHIEHKAELSGFDNSTTLRVHRQSLEAVDDEGPYELGDLIIRQLPARPGERTRFGPELEERFGVSGFDFDRYSDENYEDPMREARLEFLRSAAQGQ